MRQTLKREVRARGRDSDVLCVEETGEVVIGRNVHRMGEELQGTRDGGAWRAESQQHVYSESMDDQKSQYCQNRERKKIVFLLLQA